VIRNATKAFMTIAAFNQLMMRDEYEEPFDSLLEDMKDYYNDRLCDLYREMLARRMSAVDYVDFSVIPSEFTSQELRENRIQRHDRDYYIIRDTRKVIQGFEQQFERFSHSTTRSNSTPRRRRHLTRRRRRH
jgi:hypothetical protein